MTSRRDHFHLSAVLAQVGEEAETAPHPESLIGGRESDSWLSFANSVGALHCTLIHARKGKSTTENVSHLESLTRGLEVRLPSVISFERDNLCTHTSSKTFEVCYLRPCVAVLSILFPWSFYFVKGKMDGSGVFKIENALTLTPIS